MSGGPLHENVATADLTLYRDGPRQSRPSDGTVERGTPIAVLKEAGSCVRIRAESGEEGYISADGVGPRPR